MPRGAVAAPAAAADAARVRSSRTRPRRPAPEAQAPETPAPEAQTPPTPAEQPTPTPEATPEEKSSDAAAQEDQVPQDAPRPPPRASTGQTTVHFGEYGIKALEEGWVTNRQIEAARIAMTRKIKRGGKVWINIFPDKPYTKKPAETRMGKGKGSPEGWVAVVKPGRVMFELAGVPEPLAKEALRLAGAEAADQGEVREAREGGDLFAG